MPWKQRRRADIARADGFVAGIGVGHRHDVEPQAFDDDAEHAGHARRVVAVSTFGGQQGVELGGASASACFQFARCSAAGESKFSGVVRGLATIDTGILGPLQVSGTAKKGQDVFLAVRPEKLKLALKKPTAALNAITGVVSAISYHGDRHYFLVTAQGFDRPVSVSQQNDSELKSWQVHAGVKVWVAWPATSVLVPAQ